MHIAIKTIQNKTYREKTNEQSISVLWANFKKFNMYGIRVLKREKRHEEETEKNM